MYYDSPEITHYCSHHVVCQGLAYELMKDLSHSEKETYFECTRLFNPEVDSRYFQLMSWICQRLVEKRPKDESGLDKLYAAIAAVQALFERATTGDMPRRDEWRKGAFAWSPAVNVSAKELQQAGYAATNMAEVMYQDGFNGVKAHEFIKAAIVYATNAGITRAEMREKLAEIMDS